MTIEAATMTRTCSLAPIDESTVAQNETQLVEEESAVLVEHDADRQAEMDDLPLRDAWTLWYDAPAGTTSSNNSRSGGGKGGKKDWAANLQSVYTVRSVASFWRTFNNVLRPSALPNGGTFHLFKHGIRPEWEDPQNAPGGSWTFNLPQRISNDTLDQYWMHTVLACIGATFPASDALCGCIMSIRARGHRIAIWTRNADNKEDNEAIGAHLKQVLQLPDSVSIGFQKHGAKKDLYFV